MKKEKKKNIDFKNEKISVLLMILIVLYVGSYMITNILASKMIQLPFNITMTGGFLIFPITYILSDIFSEVYGYKWSRFTSYLSLIMNILMVIIFSIVLITPAPSYWTDQTAYVTVLGNTPRIVIASFVAFFLGDFINDRVFKKMKDRHMDNHKGFGWRAILSSFCGEFVDSFIFLPLAFLGSIPLNSLWLMTLIQVFLKTGYEIIVLPLTQLAVKKISKYEENNKKIF